MSEEISEIIVDERTKKRHMSVVISDIKIGLLSDREIGATATVQNVTWNIGEDIRNITISPYTPNAILKVVVNAPNLNTALSWLADSGNSSLAVKYRTVLESNPKTHSIEYTNPVTSMYIIDHSAATNVANTGAYIGAEK